MCRGLITETLEDRRLLASNAVAMVVSGFGGADYPEGVIEELRALGYHGFGDPTVDGGLRSNWNSLDHTAGDAGDFEQALTVTRTTFSIPDADLETEFGVPGLPTIPGPPDVTLPTGLNLQLFNLGSPNSSQQIIIDAANQLSAFSDDDTIILIGHSLGGDTVLKIAKAVDVEIDLLVLLDPVGFIEPPNPIPSLPIPASPFDRGDLPPLPGIPAGMLPVDVAVNSVGEIPGFYQASSLTDAVVPSNVKYLYNRWQTNALFPIDFAVNPRMTNGTGTESLFVDFGIPDQQEQDTKVVRYIPGADGDLSALAILAPENMDLEPFDLATITIPDPLNPPTFMSDVSVPDAPNADFGTSNAQLHHDFPQNDTIQNELIAIIREITPALAPDQFEPNNTIADATVLGSVPEVILTDLTIHDAADVDVFRITANETGKLIVNVLFEDVSGDLNARILDTNGNLIADSASITDNERLVIPVVGQETYYVEVNGFGDDTNCYDLELENFAVPIPQAPVLHPDDDNGISDDDNITDVTDPVVLVQADLAGFEQMGIRILSAAEAAAGVTDGAAVEVFVNGESQGFADAVGSSSTLFEFELSSLVLQNGLPITGGTLNFITAAVRIFDQQRDEMGAPAPGTDRSQLSESLRLRYQDVLGPRVNDVTVTGDPGYDLFLPKPTNGPTPLVESLTVEFTPTYDVDNNVDADYEDIGATGTEIVFASDDDAATEVPVGFDFPFFDGLYDSVYVSTNGMLTFGSGFTAATNLDLTTPANAPIQPVIAPLWDDWDTDPAFSDGVYYEMRGTPGVDLRLIVQWRNIEHLNADGVGGDPTVDFEAVLFEDGTIEFRYNDAVTGEPTEDFGNSATVGIREGVVLFGGGRGVHQVSFDEPAIFDGRAIRFTPPFDSEIVTNVGHYSLVGDATGHAHIESATFLAPNKVQLDLAEPLPDDRFTFTISDSLTDLTGNALDGESQVAAPGGYVLLPSGDGVPGGDFVARFTVDTRPEIGVWAAGSALIDINGNFLFDPDNVDAVNRDLAFHLGFSSDSIVAGNFVDTLAQPGAKADGFDKLAIYGRTGNGWRWSIDTDNNGVPDLVTVETASGINGLPVAGNFDGDATNGDEIGVFDGRRWYFDVDRSFTLQNNVGISASHVGFPIVGDFDGDGDDDVGTYVASHTGGNLFSIDLNTAGPGAPIVIDGNADFVFRVGIAGLGAGSGFFGFPGVRERPVAADMNADGVDDVGLWVPNGSALVPGNQGEWYFLLSGDDPTTDEVEQSVFARIDDGFIPFTPVPFGDDIYARFGNNFAVPIVGNFDPPLPGGAGSGTGIDETATSLPQTVTAPEPPVDDGKESPPGPVVDEVVTDEGSSLAFDAGASAAYVEALYRDLLGRDSDAAGTAAWLGELRDGMTRQEVASAFWFSTERMQRVVDHFYHTYLGRAADPNGRAHWTSEMVHGLTEADLAVTFLTSGEFVSRFRDDVAYVDALYQHVVGRSADRPGRDHWVAQLRGGLARGDFVRAMFASREKQTAIVDAVYEDLLRRDVDPVGLDLYLNLATSALGKRYDVASRILASDEYFQRIHDS
jgi:hypothetical protein